jgi:protein gp37
MSEHTAIGWCDSTWNPWHGCRKVSPGCKHCYMFTAKRRYGQDPQKVVRAAPTTFRAPLRWTEPKRIFTCSWSDFFIEMPTEHWRDEAWQIIQATPQHTYLILTKRPQNMPGTVPWTRQSMGDWFTGRPWPTPRPHVWLGVSVESTRYYERIDRLVQIPAARRFLSLEPLLGPLPDLPLTGIDWVIVGGESGPRHRPMAIEWVAEIRDQCTAAGVPLFVKQDCGPREGQQGRLPDALWRLKNIPRIPGDPLMTTKEAE